MQDKRHRTGRGALRALILIGALIGVSGAAGWSVTAQAANRGYTITSFDAIRVEAPVNVIVTTGMGVSARADGDQQMLDRLKVDVSGRLLSITMERARPGESGGGAVTLRLSTGLLNRIVLTGGGSVAVNRMKGQRGEIVLGGNGDVSVGAVELDQIEVALAGGGRATLNGRAGVANIRITGPGAVEAGGLSARQASISNDGAGSVTLTADINARLRASGSGDMTVTGKAACSVENSGTGRVRCGGKSF
ncbi:Putative auto-transporter adhesin, head GIN domain [Sphingobium faniae]|nr:Putative auto-transporter adhesin, head GIN domain [Sphingobium faniae]